MSRYMGLQKVCLKLRKIEFNQGFTLDILTLPITGFKVFPINEQSFIDVLISRR